MSNLDGTTSWSRGLITSGNGLLNNKRFFLRPKNSAATVGHKLPSNCPEEQTTTSRTISTPPYVRLFARSTPTFKPTRRNHPIETSRNSNPQLSAKYWQWLKASTKKKLISKDQALLLTPKVLFFRFRNKKSTCRHPARSSRRTHPWAIPDLGGGSRDDLRV